MENIDFLQVFENDFTNSKNKHDIQISKINNWVDEYEGKQYGNENEYKSKIVWKLIKKQGESLIANIIKPFIGSYDIVECEPLTSNDIYKSRIDSRNVNYFYNKEFDNNTFIKSLAKTMAKQGTSFIRVGWEKNIEVNKVKIEKSSPELLAKLQQNGVELEKEPDGSIYAINKKILKNKPTAKVVRASDIYIGQPTDSFEEAPFVIYQYITNLSELKQQPDLYTDDAIKNVENILDRLDDTKDNQETNSYNTDNSEFIDRARKNIKLYEYWGKYDNNGDGIAEDIVAVVAEVGSQKTIMKIKPNPFPFKKPPFIAVNLYNQEFSPYGDALAEMIGDEQKLMTAIVRGIIDNMATSSNGQKFITKGSIDDLNIENMLKGYPVIKINTRENINSVVKDGNFNELPSSVYNMLQMLEQQAETLTGINRFMQGGTSPDLKAAASNFSTMMSQSQIRLLDITNNISIGIKKMFLMWIEMISEYLSDEEVYKITGIDINEAKAKETQKLVQQFGIDELPENSKQGAMLLIMKWIDDMFDKKDVKYDIKIKINTDGLKQVKTQQINMLMQQATGLIQTGSVPPDAIKKLIAEMAELLDFPDIAKDIRTYQPQPDPIQQQMTQIQMEQEKAKAMKDKALADNAMARTKQTMVKAGRDQATLDADVTNKYVDATVKIKDADTRAKINKDKSNAK